MTKLKFLLELEKALSGLPQQDIEERLTFYSEVIEDRVEEGVSEEEAVAQIGSIEEIAAQILADHPVENPTTKEDRSKTDAQTKRKWKTWEIVLLVLGSPLWIVLLIAALAVVFSLVVSVLAAVFSIWISLWAVFVSLIACAVTLPVAAVYFICCDYLLSGLAVIGASLVCGGLGIFFFYGCKLATKGMALLTKLMAISLKKCSRRKEEV